MTTVAAALQHVEECINTQQQSLTCLSLSSALGISTAGAAKVLEQFRIQREKAGVTLRCLVSISGKLKAASDSGMTVAVVAKEKVSEVLPKFDNPSSEIYSISPPDETKSEDVNGTLADLWAEDLTRVTHELTEARKQNGLWRPSHLPPSYCTPTATEKRELVIPGYKGGKPIPSPMVEKPGATTKSAAPKSAVFKPSAAAKRMEETPMPDVSKVKLTDKTPAAGEKRKADSLTEADPTKKTTKTSMKGGYLVMEDAEAPASTITTTTTTNTASAAAATASTAKDDSKKAAAPAPAAPPAAAPKAKSAGIKKGAKQLTMHAFFKKKS